MAMISPKFVRFLPLGGVLLLGAVAGVAGMSTRLAAQAVGEEPIAYIGHGVFFERGGRAITPTAEWVAKTQDWYRAHLMSALDPAGKAEFAGFEKRLISIKAEGQAALIVRQRGLDWLVANAPRARVAPSTIGKLSLLSYRLQWVLPVAGSKKRSSTPYTLDPAIQRQLDAPGLMLKRKRSGGNLQMLASGTSEAVSPTLNRGREYVEECRAQRVPIPPPINDLTPGTGWVKEGFIRQAEQFIVQTPAEIRSYTTPDGVCIALPRSLASDDNNPRVGIDLDGVICLSRITSKVCIWDNQMWDPSMGRGQTFTFGWNERIPIGAPDLAVNPRGLYQAGGQELEGGSGGICTDCHAGENPFIVHPDTELLRERVVSPSVTALEPIVPTLTWGEVATRLNQFAPQRYDPIVAGSWPQNSLSHAEPLVPPVCLTCHVQGRFGAGRLPHLNSDLEGYCDTILTGAVQGLPVSDRLPLGASPTMPTTAPGSQAGNAEVIAFRAWCGVPGTSGPDVGSSRGEPHLVTTNGVSYDFQSAGEFTALRNSSTGFELQTRQTPVTASFIPGANPYTGLQSCLSVNTAAALRLGGRRVTFQPESGQGMVLRIDGKKAKLTKRGVNIGGGNRIADAPSGQGFTVIAADGTRVAITSEYWGPVASWYLNIEVLNTPAREGLLGPVLPGQWLPLGPNGAALGPAPDTLAGRDVLLNASFANGWRVTPATSLFDYAPGTSTATFTDPGWPPRVGSACVARPGLPVIPGPGRKIKPLDKPTAEKLCRKYLRAEPVYRECVYDTMVMGDPNVPAGYARSLAARRSLMP